MNAIDAASLGEVRSRDRAGKGGKRRATGSKSDIPDRVTISAEARRLVEESGSSPDTDGDEGRAALVAALRERVRAGTYRPDLRRTAQILVHDGGDALI